MPQLDKFFSEHTTTLGMGLILSIAIFEAGIIFLLFISDHIDLDLL